MCAKDGAYLAINYIYKMTLKPIISGVLKLALILLSATLAAEIAIENHQSPLSAAIPTALNRTA